MIPDNPNDTASALISCATFPSQILMSKKKFVKEILNQKCISQKYQLLKVSKLAVELEMDISSFDYRHR